MSADDTSRVGQYLGRHEYLVRPSSIDAYVAATGDDHPWYRGPSPFGGPVAPALLLHSEQYAFPLRDWYLPNRHGNLHIRQDWELFAPAMVGDHLVSTGMIVDRYLRKDRDVVVLEFTVSNEGGVMLARGRCHQSFLLETAIPAGDVAVPERTTRASGLPALPPPVLESLPPITHEVTLERCHAFSGPARNYHNDVDEARKLGFPDVVVQGTMSTCFISQLMTRRFGEGWFCGGRMSLKLVNVLWGGETVIAAGAVRDITPEGGHRRGHLDVWTAKPDGTKTIVGTASALILDPCP